MNRTKSNEKVGVKLTAAERAVLLDKLTALPPEFQQAIRAASTTEPIMLTLEEIYRLVGQIAVEADRTKDKKVQKELDVITGKIQHLICSHADEEPPHILKIEDAKTEKPIGRRKTGLKSGQLYQFKITLCRVEPPIWRRIQVKDCTLNKLHEHIQTAMGWTNSHLHLFEIGGQQYGNPELLEDDFNCLDSTCTKISRILPTDGRQLSFKYEYDFGDSWDHEVSFEGCPAVDPKAKYPLCVEGKRACPPEDVGGARSYAVFLEAIADERHAQHMEMLEWIGGPFDPEAFGNERATKAMRQGLPDWREMEEDWLIDGE